MEHCPPPMSRSSLRSSRPRCDRAADFPKHCARFNRSIRRLNRAQLRLDNAYTIVPTSQALYQYLLESIAHIPQFALLISSFGTSHPTMAQQTHSSLQKFLLDNMDFAQNFAATEGFIGLLSQQSSSSSVPPPPPTQPTKSAARRARRKEREEQAFQARLQQAMSSMHLSQTPPFPPPPYPVAPPLPHQFALPAVQNQRPPIPRPPSTS